jgi:hypothetical protein
MGTYCAVTLTALAEAWSSISQFPRDWILPEEEIEKLKSSGHPEDLHKIGLHYLATPFLSEFEASKAFDFLNQSLQLGNVASAPFIAFLLFNGLGVNQNIKQSLQILKSLSNPHDSWYQYFFYSFSLSLDSRYLDKLVKDNLMKSVKAGNLNSLHRFGIHTYFGNLGIPRSNSKAFGIFSRGAAS